MGVLYFFMKNIYPNRQTIRLPYYDYSQPGWYFVTICVADRELFFGTIQNNQMFLSSLGKQIENFWLTIPQHFSGVFLDAYVIMPNHLHGIIVISSEEGEILPIQEIKTLFIQRTLPAIQAIRTLSTVQGVGTLHCNVPTTMSEISPKRGSLSVIIRSFKSICTKHINKTFPKISFGWQARFYEHIIRDEMDLERIRNYIQNNVSNWSLDQFHP